MQCITVQPTASNNKDNLSDSRMIVERDKDHRRVSRGLPSCLKGERDDVECKNDFALKSLLFDKSILLLITHYNHSSCPNANALLSK